MAVLNGRPWSFVCQAPVRLSVDQVLDPNDGVTILQHHTPSRVQALCNALKDGFGDNDWLQITQSLESFFDLHRPSNQGLQEGRDVEWHLRYDKANQRAGLKQQL